MMERYNRREKEKRKEDGGQCEGEKVQKEAQGQMPEQDATVLVQTVENLTKLPVADMAKELLALLQSLPMYQKGKEMTRKEESAKVEVPERKAEMVQEKAPELKEGEGKEVLAEDDNVSDISSPDEDGDGEGDDPKTKEKEGADSKKVKGMVTKEESKKRMEELLKGKPPTVQKALSKDEQKKAKAAAKAAAAGGGIVKK